MNINDLLYNNNETIDERSIVYFDWCNWIHQPLDTDIFTCKDVRDCIDSDFIMSLLNIWDWLSITTSEMWVDISWVDDEIIVSFDWEVLVIWNTEINITNFLDDLSITFNDWKNWFNTLWITEIYIEAMDGLVFTNDWVDTLSIWLPTPPAEYFLDHNNDWPSPQLPWDYLPFNHRLVLTRDWVNHRAFWAVDQCCPHVLEFVKGKLSADNKESFVDLLSINSDNQQLSLDINELSLSRWHWWSLWEQIIDADSIVDLSNVNEHTLSLALNRYLWIYWSDWILNNKVDLLNVWPKTITYNSATSEIEIRNDNWDIVSSVDISWINSQNLVWSNWMIQLDWVNGTWVSQAWFRKPVHFCSDTLWCVCWNRMTKAERESFWLTSPSWWVMPTWRTTRWYPQPTSRPDGREDFLDTNPTPCDMINFVVARIWWRANFNWYTYINIENETYIYNNYIANYNYSTNNYTTYNVWNTTNNTINNYYFGWWSTYIWDVYQNITQGTSIIAKTKYRGRIYTSETRVMRSQNRWTWIDGWLYARRYIPQMDKWDWRANSSTQMLNPTNFIPENTDTLYIGSDAFILCPQSWYTTAKSANNPNNADEGKLCRAESKTLTIPFDWMYQISANLEFEVDHNVHAFRASILWRSVDDNLIRPLVDTKWWWDTTVGSRSLNNPAYPETKQYTCSGSKLVELKKGDVLFLWIRIDPGTSWPKDIPAVWLNEQTPKFGNIYSNHTPWTASWLYVSWSPWTFSMDINYTYPWIPSWFDNTTNIFRPAPMAPDLTQRRYWSPVWWMSWSDAYWYSLAYPDMDNGYWNDDWVVKLLWPSNIISPSWSWWESCPEGWSMITAVYVNKKYAVSP